MNANILSSSCLTPFPLFCRVGEVVVEGEREMTLHLHHAQTLACIAGAILLAATLFYVWWICTTSCRVQSQPYSSIPKWKRKFFSVTLIWVILGILLILGGLGRLIGSLIAEAAGVDDPMSFKPLIGIYLGRGGIVGVLCTLFGFRLVHWYRGRRRKTALKLPGK